METTRMTIHRALSELKLIDAKIEKKIKEISPTGVYQKDKLIFNQFKKEDFETSARSTFDSINDLIVRKTRIKSAIVKANGETPVVIGTTAMMIADAINFKNVIKFKKQLIESLKAKHQAAISVMNKNNDLVEKNVQSILEATFGKENVKAGRDDVDSVRKPYMEANQFHLLDPLEVNKKVEQLEKEVGDFEAEVDAVLSEINAVTFIEI